ncbi:MAG: PEP/pyruvate-binding domain-containing protein [Patescibacteria group bacterium]
MKGTQSNVVGLFVMEHLPSIIWFKDCVNYSLSIVGDKGVDLGKLETVKLPIPPGFVIPAHVFSHALSPSQKDQIEHLFSQIDDKNPEKLHQISTQIIEIIDHLEIDQEVATEIAQAYEKLGPNTFVAVRSSKTQTRLPDLHATFFNIKGDANVIHTVKKTWAALFQPKMLLTLFENLISPTQISQAVVVQRMTESKVAGVAYSKNPDNQNKRTVVIDAIWGIGEYLNDHMMQADRYEIEKDSWEIIQQNRHAQDMELVRKVTSTQEIPIPDSRKFSPKLNSTELKKLAQLAIKIQQFLFFPQRIEWSLENDQFYILQTEQLMEKVGDPDDNFITQIGTMRPTLYGSSVHPGLISGKVRICRTPEEYAQIQSGEILVTDKLNLLNVEHLRKAAGIVADQAFFPRDVQSLGIPCIGSTHFGSHIFKNGQLITIFGQQGVVYDGSLQYRDQKSSSERTRTTLHTKLYLSTGEPANIKTMELHQIAGIGLLRAEYLVAQIGLHPKHAIRQRKEHLFIHKLAEGIKTVCQTVHPKPVYYRFLDMTSDELRQLEGGTEYEQTEKNPAIGYRGAFRYLTDLASFNLELEAIKMLKHEGYDNLHVMIPFIRSIEELVLLKSHMEKRGLKQSHHFQIWMMVDTPAVAIELDTFLSHGVDGITIGAKDLKMLLLGLDSDISNEFSVSYDHSPGFRTIIKMVIESAQKYQRPVIFCEHNLDQELIEFLVHSHVEGISVNAKQIPYLLRMLREN